MRRLVFITLALAILLVMLAAAAPAYIGPGCGPGSANPPLCY